MPIKEIAVYLIIINIISVITCISDKTRAKRGLRRISEKTLFALCFLGGGPGMYGTMKLIRHKTLHKRFMIGIPLIIITEAAALILWLK